MLNTYVTIVNRLAGHLNDFHSAGIDTTPILNKVKNVLILFDFTALNTFLSSCESVFFLISPELSAMIAAHVDIAASDTQRYIEIIDDAANLVLDHAEKSKAIISSSNVYIQDLSSSMSSFTYLGYQQANKVVNEIDLLSKDHMDVGSKVIRITYENTVSTSMTALNAAQAVFSLTLLHLLPRQSVRPDDPSGVRSDSKFDK